MSLKERSKLWIVSTHVLTTGLAIPLLATLMAMMILPSFGMIGVMNFSLLLTISALGYIGGTYYSLSYLRRNTIFNGWEACTKPSVISFSVLTMLRFWRNAQQQMDSPLAAMNLTPSIHMRIAMEFIFYVIIIVAFGVISQRAFRTFDQD